MPNVVGAPAQFHANSAITDDAEGLAGQFDALEFLLHPLALFHGGVGPGDFTSQGHHEAEGKLGDRHGRGRG